MRAVSLPLGGCLDADDSRRGTPVHTHFEGGPAVQSGAVDRDSATTNPCPEPPSGASRPQGCSAVHEAGRLRRHAGPCSPGDGTTAGEVVSLLEHTAGSPVGADGRMLSTDELGAAAPPFKPLPRPRRSPRCVLLRVIPALGRHRATRAPARSLRWPNPAASALSMPATTSVPSPGAHGPSMPVRDARTPPPGIQRVPSPSCSRHLSPASGRRDRTAPRAPQDSVILTGTSNATSHTRRRASNGRSIGARKDVSEASTKQWDRAARLRDQHRPLHPERAQCPVRPEPSTSRLSCGPFRPPLDAAPEPRSRMKKGS